MNRDLCVLNNIWHVEGKLFAKAWSQSNCVLCDLCRAGIPTSTFQAEE